MANLGFIGLGVMGSRMVKRLLEAGHTVTGYNRTKSKGQWLLDAGMQWGDTPRAVVETSDITLSMVTNTAALKAVAEGLDGILAGLGPGKIYIDMSTVSPAASRELATPLEFGDELPEQIAKGQQAAKHLGVAVHQAGTEQRLQRALDDSHSRKESFRKPSLAEIRGPPPTAPNKRFSEY